MTGGIQLGYLALEVSDLPVWATFAAEQLGLMVEHDGDEVRLRMDDLQQRFVLRAGPADDVAAVGLLLDNDDVADELIARVRSAGYAVEDASAEAARGRRVKRLARFTDPSGIPVELATAPLKSVVPFSSRHAPAGFVTGPEGLGHAVFMVDDAGKSLDFWTHVLGFQLSDSSSHETPAGESNAFFLHCNSRHHSIALVQRSANSVYPHRLLHFMIEAATMDAVGLAYDRAIDGSLNINRSLGQHPNDRMLSFYATTPSGFDFEFGWGGVKVSDEWPVAHYDFISAWGHRKVGVVRPRHG